MSDKMKLYLSSYRIPTPQDLFELIGKNPAQITVALIPNAKDYYAKRARDFRVNDMAEYLKSLLLQVAIVDLRDYEDEVQLEKKLLEYGIIWAMGGNTFCLRYEMKRSGFENIIQNVLAKGVVYGGDSAGAAVAGVNLKGIELADEPEFAEEVIWDGLNLIPNYILPHVGNETFGDTIEQIKQAQSDKSLLIELTDSQAYVFNNGVGQVVDGEK